MTEVERQKKEKKHAAKETEKEATTFREPERKLETSYDRTTVNGMEIKHHSEISNHKREKCGDRAGIMHHQTCLISCAGRAA